MAKRTARPTPEPTEVYCSPEGRVRVMMVRRDGVREFDLYTDDRPAGAYATQSAAEQAGWAWLAEQAEELAWQLRDEAAARAA